MVNDMGKMTTVLTLTKKELLIKERKLSCAHKHIELQE